MWDVSLNMISPIYLNYAHLIVTPLIKTWIWLACKNCNKSKFKFLNNMIQLKHVHLAARNGMCGQAYGTGKCQASIYKE